MTYRWKLVGYNSENYTLETECNSDVPPGGVVSTVLTNDETFAMNLFEAWQVAKTFTSTIMLFDGETLVKEALAKPKLKLR